MASALQNTTHMLSIPDPVQIKGKEALHTLHQGVIYKSPQERPLNLADTAIENPTTMTNIVVCPLLLTFTATPVSEILMQFQHQPLHLGPQIIQEEESNEDEQAALALAIKPQTRRPDELIISFINVQGLGKKEVEVEATIN